MRLTNYLPSKINSIFIVLGFILLGLLYMKKSDEVYLTILTPRVYQCSNNESSIEIGRTHLSKSTVIIAALARDVVHRVTFLKKMVKRVTNQFMDYRILIVENDSKDRTREYLLDWASYDKKIIILGCGENALKCSLNFSKTIGHGISVSRIDKMIYLRNLYLSYIESRNFINFDYLIVWDIDLYGSIHLDGIWDTGYHLSINQSIQSICPNSRVIYWGLWTWYLDPYAHKETRNLGLTKKQNDWWSKMNLHYSCNEPLNKVISCFNGFMIYRLDSLKSSQNQTQLKRYKSYLDSQKKPVCEHVGFNEQFTGVYLNPAMIYSVLDNSN